MTKTSAWFKKHLYKWGNETLEKANTLSLYSMVVVGLSFASIMTIGESIGLSDNVKGGVEVVSFLLLGMTIGSSFVLRWADEQIKKNK